MIEGLWDYLKGQVTDRYTVIGASQEAMEDAKQALRKEMAHPSTKAKACD